MTLRSISSEAQYVNFVRYQSSYDKQVDTAINKITRKITGCIISSGIDMFAEIAPVNKSEDVNARHKKLKNKMTIDT